MKQLVRAFFLSPYKLAMASVIAASIATRVQRVALLAAVFVASFAGAALAQGGASALGIDSPIDALGRAVYNAFRAGQHTEGALVALILTTAILRRFGGRIHPAMSSGVAARAYVIVAAIAGKLLADGLNAGNAWDALLLAAGAAGAYDFVSRVGRALAGWRYTPGWLRAALRPFGWLFGSAIADAERAGDAAVTANPGAGAGQTGRIP